ncbi:carbohydrate sulfotransferase 1-like [Acanthaster planci]|uniref:Carbohydrate sulfotransferase 1-like n=1 Tax=Acanthaster planci TaxID=133434 RepID=A0A8B7ZAY2_ACAPL|nr:carbohydrate sulfotransferase 1-like [Acanthaster planci]
MQVGLYRVKCPLTRYLCTCSTCTTDGVSRYGELSSLTIHRMRLPRPKTTASNRRILLFGMISASAVWISLIYVGTRVEMLPKITGLWRNGRSSAGTRAGEELQKYEDTNARGNSAGEVVHKQGQPSWGRPNITGDRASQPLGIHVLELQAGQDRSESLQDLYPSIDALLRDMGVMNVSETSAEHDSGSSPDGKAHARGSAVLSTPDSKVRVIILASMRTGSSFVGEFLGNNQDAFYLFEPGLSVTETFERYKLGPGVQENVHLKMLQKLFRCDFQGLGFYIKWLSRHSLQSLHKIAPRFYSSCTRTLSGRRTEARWAQCSITQGMATSICKKSDFIVVKSIRVPDINLLLPMLEDKTETNLKVIHLVRDPRAMMKSRVGAMRDTNLRRLSTDDKYTLSTYCKYNLANLELGTRRPSLKQRYMFLRYEDAAQDPRGAAARIYQFLGRSGQVPESVTKWIESNTVTYKPGIYSTTRNSVYAYQKWRLTLPAWTAVEIQKTGQCAGMMRRMGYHSLDDRWHLRNLSRRLVDPIPPTKDDEKYDWAWF